MENANFKTPNISGTTLNAKLQTPNYFSLGFSPCPNDTFMFDALVNGKIDAGDIFFNPQLEDIETLNRKAIRGELDITKISFGVYSQIKDAYELLTAGAALGTGVGPLFISKKKFDNPSKEIKTVAIPGIHTTAFLLFKMFYPDIVQTKEMVFSEIENAILNEEVDAGVIIHENRFTYEAKGLKKISDLGELWEKLTGQPIPLGGIVIKRSIDTGIKKKINSLLKQSVEFAFANPESGFEYIRKHAQEMSEEVRKKHIELYVNKYSVDLGESGRQAISTFLSKAGISDTIRNLYVNETV
jgi:1,4-dihydroxy-6-naphthoate synthase